MNTKINLNELLGKPVEIWEKFHQKTKFTNFNKDLLERKNWPKQWKTVYFKGYSRLEQIILPKPELDKFPLIEALKNRKSSRKFSKIPLNLSKLGTLLFYSAGLKKNIQPWYASRFYPSGGSRYPLEIYCIVLNADLPRGIYHYYIKSHSLEKLLIFEYFNLNKYFNQNWLKNTGVIILITAVFNRMTIKYGNRGYRHIMIEAGHIGQNLYLNSVALKINCCAIGGYLDDKLNQLLDIEGIKESIIYALAIGNSI